LPSYYEFFAGGGMARAGLGQSWQCLLANDIDQKKAAAYAQNWGGEHLLIDDVANLSASDLPGSADLAWASFPCQDLSLAGCGAGINGARSGTFWPFWRLMRDLARDGRGPSVIVLENVYGALRSHGGKAFAAIGSAFSGINYRFGAIIIDAADFLPQSRQRLFIVGIHPCLKIPAALQAEAPSPLRHPPALLEAREKLSKIAQKKWLWWRLPKPPVRKTGFSAVIEEKPSGVQWHTKEETAKLLSMMSDVNLAKVDKAKKLNRRLVGGVYKRTRNGVQRAEVRFDDVAGCLRTPAGGSSRQTVLIVEGGKIRSRLLSPREAARLMGLPEDYKLPVRYNDAYHLAGDGVAVPVVRFLAEHLFEPILVGRSAANLAA